ncbi:hypothetical protein GCM10012275_17270 [Longimycelium tulufanense]|uniref:Uncharacterized protein n=1 Tax=Longimycelium tulufanense TaxID=907463 RepID=A0A8J3C761_9PSEU|nr:hypothetical protein [Longimycelium tulufanense]GGM46750.1 hypothetical protein GCM10012275_17270 [Longimycelium tulufanense]
MNAQSSRCMVGLAYGDGGRVWCAVGNEPLSGWEKTTLLWVILASVTVIAYVAAYVRRR